MTRTSAFCMILPLLVAACAPQPAEERSPKVAVATSDSCGATDYIGLRGQDGTILERMLILRQVRIVRPGQAYDEALRPERLNFVIDTRGRISDVHCG